MKIKNHGILMIYLDDNVLHLQNVNDVRLNEVLWIMGKDFQYKFLIRLRYNYLKTEYQHLNSHGQQYFQQKSYSH